MDEIRTKYLDAIASAADEAALEFDGPRRGIGIHYEYGSQSHCTCLWFQNSDIKQAPLQLVYVIVSGLLRRLRGFRRGFSR